MKKVHGCLCMSVHDSNISILFKLKSCVFFPASYKLFDEGYQYVSIDFESVFANVPGFIVKN